MIDIHNHILPNLDDGPRNWEQSLVMARIAVADGIEQIVCTPHCVAGAFENTRELVLPAVKEFQEKLSEQGIPLQVYPGAELRLDPDLAQKVKSGQLPTVADNGRYILLELPDIFLPQKLEDFFRNLAMQDIVPIICHPERNRQLNRDPMPLFRWIETGALVQITAASITGHFGSGIRRLSLSLLGHGLAHVIGTDAHDPRLRTPVLSGALREVESVLGKESAEAMIRETPRRILCGDSVAPARPIPFSDVSSGASFSRRIFSFLGLA